MVFLVILAVVQMVIGTTRLKGLDVDKYFSHHDMIGFFKFQLRAKIRSDRKRLDCIFDKRWGHEAKAWSKERKNLGNAFSSHAHEGTQSWFYSVILSLVKCYTSSIDYISWMIVLYSHHLRSFSLSNSICLSGFYGISSFVGYLMLNPFLYK